MDLIYNNTFNCILFFIEKAYKGTSSKAFVLLAEIREALLEMYSEEEIEAAIGKLSKDGKIHLGPGDVVYLKESNQVLMKIRIFPKSLPTEFTLNN